MNCTAHADVEQSDGGALSANQTMIEHTPHAIQLYYIDQWAAPANGGFVNKANWIEEVIINDNLLETEANGLHDKVKLCECVL